MGNIASNFFDDGSLEEYIGQIEKPITGSHQTSVHCGDDQFFDPRSPNIARTPIEIEVKNEIMCSIDETQECCDQASNPDQFFDPRSPNIARTPIEIEVENASQCSQKSLQVAYCSKMGHVFDFSSLGIAACSTPAPNVLALPSEEKFDFSSLILAASTTTTRPTTNDIVDENGGPSSYLSLLKKAPSSRSRVPLGDSNHLALALSHLQYRTNRGI